MIQPGRWVFEGGNSSVAFSVRHLMISRVRGGFRRFSGWIDVAADPERSVVHAEIETASVDTGMEARDKDLRGPDFLDVERHPLMVFDSTAVHPGWKLEGNLTVAGVARPVVLTVEFRGAVTDNWGNHKAVFSATTTLDREEFGLTYNRTLETGGVLIGSQVEVEIEIQAKPEG